jgi:hypothetical protein
VASRERCNDSPALLAWRLTSPLSTATPSPIGATTPLSSGLIGVVFVWVLQELFSTADVWFGQRILCSRGYGAHIHILNLGHSFLIEGYKVFLHFPPLTSPSFFCLTPCAVLDLLLSGSLPATSITEIAGKSTSGKTQLYLQLALLVPLSLLSASSHFLHSDIPFPFCSLRCLTPTSHPDILNHVLIATAHSPAELLSLLTYAQCVLAHPNHSPHRLTIRLDFNTSPADLRGRSIVVTNQMVDTVAWQSGIDWPYFILAQGAKLSVQVYAGG